MTASTRFPRDVAGSDGTGVEGRDNNPPRRDNRAMESVSVESGFRRLSDAELMEAHGIIAEVTEWLQGRGIVQWPRVLPIEEYRARQSRGENFGLFEPTLTAVMTLAEKTPEYWRDREYRRPYLWLSTLASRRAPAGAGMRAVHAAETFAREAGYAAIYLDCVDRDDALPSLYRRAGWQQLDCREVWPGWPMCLFEKPLA